MRLAARGARETENGVEPIETPGLADQLRGVARFVHLRALGLALVLAAIVYLCPV